ncbi:MAG: helix-turn-helix domain-containing protein [Bacteroidetes bacterium]|nr:helix-turn-helix domain-containing protein [Bacteroidota bacterium]
MVKDHLREPFELVLRESMDECPRGEHMHSFFELVYIVEGRGRQSINESEFGYEPGDLFLVAPNDRHIFRIGETSRFFFIRFNQLYLRASKKDDRLAQRLELILNNSGQEPGCILKNDDDRRSVGQLMDILIREHQNSDVFHKELVGQLVDTLLTIVARNITQPFPVVVDETSERRSIDILEYIQANISSPDKLRVEAIGAHFGLSKNYLGRYFKKQTNETLQEYILKYKLRLVENRLLHSDMRVSEIADEFGFTDKSHLSRIFKRYRGVGPAEFRRSGKERLVL